MSRIAVVAVPFVQHQFHQVFLVQTVISLLGLKHEHELDLIAIVNGFTGPEKDYEFIKASFNVVEVNDKNNLARAWNKGIQMGLDRGADYILVINLDLVFHSKFLTNLIQFAQANPQAIMWSGAEWPNQESLESATLEEETHQAVNAACYLIDKRLFEVVGKFDEQFEPAYHEDTDMMYRIKLLNLPVLSTNRARFYHLGRVTLRGAMRHDDQNTLQELRIFMDLSMERYAAKWGGLPGREKFKKPYGDQK